MNPQLLIYPSHIFSLVTIKLSGLTSNILVSVDQEFGNSLAWCFWLRVAHEVTVKVLAGAAVTICSEFAATAAKSLQSCPTLCDPIDGSPPGSPVPGIL